MAKKKIKNSSFDKTMLICACGNPKHNLVVKYNEYLKTAYFEIHLNQIKLWERIKNGIKYIFNKERYYGDYVEVALNQTHADFLIELGTLLKSDNN